MPLRRYQTPSRVRQTSSASILPPLVNTITGLPPCLFAIPGPLVDTGSSVERVCEVETPEIGIFGEGEGDGEGDGDGDGEDAGEGDGDGVSATGCSVTVGMFSFCVLAAE